MTNKYIQAMKIHSYKFRPSGYTWHYTQKLCSLQRRNFSLCFWFIL